MALQTINYILVLIFIHHLIRIYVYSGPGVFPEEMRIESPISELTKLVFGFSYEESLTQEISYENFWKEIKRRFTIGGVYVVVILIMLFILIISRVITFFLRIIRKNKRNKHPELTEKQKTDLK